MGLAMKCLGILGTGISTAMSSGRQVSKPGCMRDRGVGIITNVIP